MNINININITPTETGFLRCQNNIRQHISLKNELDSIGTALEHRNYLIYFE